MDKNPTQETTKYKNRQQQTRLEIHGCKKIDMIFTQISKVGFDWLSDFGHLVLLLHKN